MATNYNEFYKAHAISYEQLCSSLYTFFNVCICQIPYLTSISRHTKLLNSCITTDIGKDTKLLISLFTFCIKVPRLNIIISSVSVRLVVRLLPKCFAFLSFLSSHHSFLVPYFHNRVNQNIYIFIYIQFSLDNRNWDHLRLRPAHTSSFKTAESANQKQ